MGTLGYYTDRARQLSPGGVAKVAARRAYRTARQFLYRRGQGLDERDLLAAFGADSAQALADSCLIPRPGLWCDVSRREETVAAVLELHSAGERAWARAERALGRTFQLFEREVCFGEHGRIEWSQDPVSGYRYPMEASTALVLTPPGVDPKYPWQLGRLEALIALGQGYWLSTAPEQKSRFAEAFASLLSDFIRANPPNMGIHWTCAMEVSLRAANIAQGLYMFRDAPAVREPGFLLTALRALADHTAYVEANLEDKGAVPNNHLIADHVGLWVVGLLFPRLPGAERQVASAARGLRDQIPTQVLEDGVSFEGSTGYHRLVAELCTLAALFSRGSQADLGATVFQRTHGLLRTAAQWCSEQGLAAQIGDNDSGRALALTDRVSLDHAYLGNLGAVMFADASLKARSDEVCDEAAWLFGLDGLRTFQALPAEKQPRSFSSARGGLHVLRGAGAVVTVSAGPQGQRGAGGHSHNDKLSFELHLKGRPVIVDPGSPIYARDPACRNAFRRTSAHNTLVVDGEEQARFDPDRLFALPEGAHARVERFDTSAHVDRLFTAHTGYQRLPEPVTVFRTLELHKAAGALLIEDRLEGVGEHGLKLHLQLPDREVRLRGPRGQERMVASRLMPGVSLDDSLAVELGPREAPRAVIFVEVGGEVSLESSDYSPGYGERVPAVRVTMALKRSAPSRWRWIVLFGR